MIQEALVRSIGGAIAGGTPTPTPAPSSGGGGGGFGGGGFGGAGGKVLQPGIAYPVGERGPELIVPNAPMRVLNNHVSKQMGKSDVRVEVVNRGTPQQASDTRANFDAKGMVISIVMDDLQRGGKLATGMSGLYGLRRKTN